MSKPAISVIIPVYNAQDGIKRCLDSLLNQSFNNFEIIPSFKPSLSPKQET